MPSDEDLRAFIPDGSPGDFILLIGAENNLAAGYGPVAEWTTGMFDLEHDFYPYPNAHFKAVVCCDVLETLTQDPMYMMDEIHRVLRPGCHLVLSTRCFTAEQTGALLENCGLAVTRIESNGERVLAAAKKVGAVRERYPKLLYPER